ncbi:MAG TPA: tetratricopeptide repeat protein [Phycisphaerae bacterium]|nr:tetratricopeptide repeat protein [Phycisphaerae bacterium]
MNDVATDEPLPISSDAEVVDVWSRTARRYRIRAALMLLLLSVLFAGLCCFTFWLHTGDSTPWTHPLYQNILARSFAPTAADQITLSDFLTRPIPVQEVPLHAVIMGLQFASLCSIPILIAILYRLPASVPFCAMIVLLAAMPWLGITVQIGCILACTGPFRFRFRYASALIGLAPIAIYFVSASWQPADSPFRMVQDQALLYAPWVLALLASCVICAAALAIARLIDYRPGGIPPVLAMLFALPVILFHTYVGRHELEYRLLKMDIGPGRDSLFAPLDIGRLASLRTIEKWTDPAERDYESIHSEVLANTENYVLERAEQIRHDAVDRCDAFIETYPTSPNVANVLYLKGRVLDLRIDETQLESSQRAEFRADEPNVASYPTWKKLVRSFPKETVAAPAMLRIAIVDTTKGNIDDAITGLSELIERFEPRSTATQPAGAPVGVAALFERTDPSESLGVRLDLTLVRAKRLLEMLQATRADAPRPVVQLFGPSQREPDELTLPVQLLLSFDPAHPNYRKNLERLVESFPGSVTAEYARVRLAMLDPALSRRILRLRKAMDQLEARPAGAEAQFCYGDALQEDHLLADAREVFESLIRNYPDSCWSADARDRISALSILMQTES